MTEPKKSLKTLEIEVKIGEKVENLAKNEEIDENENLSCCEVEANIFSKNEDGDARGDEFLPKNKAETSNNLSPEDLKGAIKKRKELYRLISGLDDDVLRRDLRKRISEIKRRQNNGELCLDELEEIDEILGRNGTTTEDD